MPRATAPTWSSRPRQSHPNPKLPGTIHTAAAEIEAAGGKALPLQCDIREEQQVVEAARQAAEAFGGIDILINNASAINLTPTESTPIKRFDLMFGVNVRGTFLCTQACLPYLKQSAERKRNPHILTLVAAAQHGAALVRASRRLHDGEVRHEHVCAWATPRSSGLTASASTHCGPGQ